jgi:hypothetical protein
MPAGPGRPEPWPTDPASAVARLATVIREIDERERNEDELLLADLLKVAWPTSQAQDQ